LLAAEHRSCRYRHLRRLGRCVRRPYDPGSREVRHRHRRGMVPATAGAVVPHRRRAWPRRLHARACHAGSDLLIATEETEKFATETGRTRRVFATETRRARRTYLDVL